MFERYTEKARRVIFFARYEASMFGSPFIETEHLLLALFREDRPLIRQFLKAPSAAEEIRKRIEECVPKQKTTSTSVDLPLSHPAKRVLAYASEESERLNDRHIGPSHLFLGLLRENGTLAFDLLKERGLTPDAVRLELANALAHRAEWLPGFETGAIGKSPQELTALRKQLHDLKGVTVDESAIKGGAAPDFAIYDGQIDDKQPPDNATAAQHIAFFRRKIGMLTKNIENAIAHHEFEKARHFSGQEREVRDALKRLCKEYGIDDPLDEIPPPVVCIEIVQEQGFSALRARIDDYLARGAVHVWLLDFTSKRAYTATESEGLRECKGDLLRLDQPVIVELDLKSIFGQ